MSNKNLTIQKADIKLSKYVKAIKNLASDKSSLHASPKKRNYNTSIFENLEDILAGLGFRYRECVPSSLSASDLLPISNKQMSLKPMHMEVSAFAKTKLTFALGKMADRK